MLWNIFMVICLWSYRAAAEQYDSSAEVSQRRYLFYDVNPGEGFNLRRDVYMRIATLARKLQQIDNSWVMVLPPWGNLYHWRSADVGLQAKLPWRLFFDLPSLNKYASVIEMDSFLKDQENPVIDEIYYLQHYTDVWESGHWVEKFEVQDCVDVPPYSENEYGLIQGSFWGYPYIHAKQFHCLSLQGHSSTLTKLLGNTSARMVMLDRAEVVLHDTFGDRDYWRARRSMRFSKELIAIAADFRRNYFNSTDATDKTERADDWNDDAQHRSAVGGPYVCVHLRRRDFLYGRGKYIPSIPEAARQVRRILKKYKLTTLFVSTDAPPEEIQDLNTYLQEFNVVTYKPTVHAHKKYKDGGVAIADQIICSHARYFIGTYESTFSFRIQEEREILGFEPNMTFNRLCGDEETDCTQPTRWTVVF